MLTPDEKFHGVIKDGSHTGKQPGKEKTEYPDKNMITRLFKKYSEDGILGLEQGELIDLINHMREFMRDTLAPLDRQVGGNHYKQFAIQPIEFVTKNNLGFIQGDVVKRICRFNLPGGKGLQDLLKIKHEIDILIHLQGYTQEAS